MSVSSLATNILPLAGRHVVITRPMEHLPALKGTGHNDPLTEQLTAWGARVSHIPLVAVQSVPYTLASDQQFDWLFFTSKNGVYSFFTRPEVPEALKDLPIAVVGPVTAKALSVYERQAAFISPRFEAESAAEAFCAAHVGMHYRILWPCGNLANERLAFILGEAGMHVTPLVVYETSLKTTLSIEEQLILHEPIDMLVFTSPSAVSAYHHWLQTVTLEKIPPVACLGPQTAKSALEQLGHVDVQALPHTLEALAEGIKAFYAGTEMRS